MTCAVHTHTCLILFLEMFIHKPEKRALELISNYIIVAEETRISCTKFVDHLYLPAEVQ